MLIALFMLGKKHNFVLWHCLTL